MHRIPSLSLLLALACGGDDSTEPTGGPPPPPTVTDTATTETTPTTPTTSTTTTSTTTGVPGTDYCTVWPAATGTVVSASPGDDLQAALDGLGPGDTLALADGTYPLTSPLVFQIEGVTLRSASGDRAAVILDGDYVSDGLIHVDASQVVIADLTLTRSAGNGVDVVPTATTVDSATLYNLEVVDNAQYGIYAINTLDAYADHITVACSNVRLTDTGRSNVVGSCQTAGIEVLQGLAWEVRDTEVSGFWCDQGLAHGGIRFWQGSRDTVLQRNRVLDSRRGIVMGVGTTLISRNYIDQPCAGERAQHFGGLVMNNIISANNGGLFDSFSPPPDGIAAESACELTVLHNSIRHLQAPTTASIVHQHPLTSGLLANNLSTGAVLRLDGSTASALPNLEGVPDTHFNHAPTGDLHLTATAEVDAVDDADPIHLATVPEDIDGQLRDDKPDYGADERL